MTHGSTRARHVVGWHQHDVSADDVSMGLTDVIVDRSTLSSASADRWVPRVSD